MRGLTQKIRGCVYLATYEHKHGVDYSLHKTYEGAGSWLKSIFDDYIDDFVSEDELVGLEDCWGVHRDKLPTPDVIEVWPDITGSTEWMNIIELPLLK